MALLMSRLVKLGYPIRVPVSIQGYMGAVHPVLLLMPTMLLKCLMKIQMFFPHTTQATCWNLDPLGSTKCRIDIYGKKDGRLGDSRPRSPSGAASSGMSSVTREQLRIRKTLHPGLQTAASREACSSTRTPCNHAILPLAITDIYYGVTNRKFRMDDLLLHVRRVLDSTRNRKQAVMSAPQSENRCAWEVADWPLRPLNSRTLTMKRMTARVIEDRQII